MREKTVSRRTTVRAHEKTQVRGSGATTTGTAGAALAKLPRPAGGTTAGQAGASARAHGLAKRKLAKRENQRKGEAPARGRHTSRDNARASTASTRAAQTRKSAGRDEWGTRWVTHGPHCRQIAPLPWRVGRQKEGPCVRRSDRQSAAWRPEWPMREKTVSRRTTVRAQQTHQGRGSGASTKETEGRSSTS